ncbi:DUF5947 family protein [Gordonia rhizosphera]|uniref:Uncharacterized protein n=1 Tax=Gordonia rhizosphera NBRC 16068 TaxID=1108045 RepID=K6VWW8_9ACTN|nr:DUF5947 family protein [Gordonia rhizosphera]GAB91395.1 hypothetical protein GORHZ_130_00180 [Gordonia rhizosphera NBRC 16068]
MTSAFEVIRRITNATPAPAADERCDMCDEPIGGDHPHVVNMEGRTLMCVCRGCYLLFTDRDATLRYRAVPDRFLSFPDDTITAVDWDALEIPVNLAFVFRNSALGRMVAFYPGPAGAIESDLSLTAWRSLVERRPVLDDLADDVEALLIRLPDRTDHARTGGPATEVLLLPIDVCYEFVAQVRLRWRGFDGGSDVKAYVDEFFTAMTARARPAGAR